MTRIEVFAFACAMALTAACGGGDDDDDDDGGGGGGPDGSPSEPTINGMPASQFFGQFHFETTQTALQGAVAFPPQPDTRNAFLANFFVMKNGEFKLFYGEGEGEVTSSGWSLNIFNDARKRRQGTWSIDGTILLFGEFLRCSGAELNGEPIMNCTLTSAVITPDAVGRGNIFSVRADRVAPDDTAFADYVP